jgi:capsular polysaccharide transport system permease protein
MRQLISRFLLGSFVQGRNIRALLLRDMMMRYGRDNIGFAWVVLEPMILTSGVMIIWSLMGLDKHGVKAVELVLTGYMPLTLWRHLTNNVVKLFRNSAPLLYHRHVTALDILAARQGLEFLGTSSALLIVWFALYAAGVVQAPERPDLLLMSWLLMAWMGVASGAAIAAVTEVSDTAERFVQPLQYLNIPISGAFFLVDWLPDWGQKLVLYHPLVHCYESFRAGYFGDAVLTHYSFPYVAACALVMTFVGLQLVHRVRSKIQLN